MRAGELKKLITIEQQSNVSDGMGGATTTWTAYASNVFASIWTVSAKEIINKTQESLNITHRIRIRYKSGITNSMRIKYGSMYYNIVSIINVGMENKMIEILANEAVI